MAEQEAQEWWKEILPDRLFADGTPVCLIKDLRGVVAYDVGEPEADRILADHKAQQEVRELRAKVGQPADSSGNWAQDVRLLQESNRMLMRTVDDLRAQLQAAEAERERQQRVNMQMADAYSATKMAMLHDLTTTAYEMLGSAANERVKWLTERDTLLAAIDAHEKAGKE